MYLVDTNVFIYANGDEPKTKAACLEFLARVKDGKLSQGVVTDAEALQEILHVYRYTGRWKKGREVYDDARKMIPAVLPVFAGTVDRARRVLDQMQGKDKTRDALHAALALELQEAGLSVTIVSYDPDFDQIKGIRRMTPDQAT